MILILLSLATCVFSLENQFSPPTLGKVDVLHNPSYRGHRPSHYIRTLLKYGITPTHPDALPVYELVSPDRRILRRDANLGLVQNSFLPSDGFYRSPLTIGEGSQAKTFNLQFDTGSPDLWVSSTLLPHNQRGDHVLYDPDKSNTSVALKKTFNISYDDGSGSSGLVFEDTVNLGGIIIKNQAVEAANQTESFVDFDADGLLGLDLEPNTITPGIVPTTIQNLIQNPAFKQPVFTALLTRASEPPGFFTFGYINDTLSASGVQFVDLVTIGAQTPGSWEFVSEYAVLNGKTISRQENTAIADSGTTGILLDDGLVREVYGLLGGHFNSTLQNWVFPANTTEFPTLTLPAGDINVTLTPPDFSVGPPDSGWLSGSLQERGDSNFDIFGTSWLNNIYAVFDLGLTGPGNTRFGLALRDPVAT